MKVALSLLFWAMYFTSKTMTWCILSLASSFVLIPRPLQHKAVLEGVVGNFDLSSEQLEEMVAVVKKKQRTYMKAYSTEYHQRAHLEDPVSVRERQRVNQANFEKNSRDKHLARFKRYSDKQTESRQFYCDVCDHASIKDYEHERHMKSKRHLKKVARGTLKAPVKKGKKRETEEDNKALKKFL
jgi:hypothetical protein